MTSTSALLISDDYATQLRTKVAKKPQWGGTAFRHAVAVSELCKSVHADSLLDYGCGTGSLKVKIEQGQMAPHLDIHEYDPSRVGKNLPAGDVSFDVVTCIDVMEHVEEDKVPAVLAHIATLTSKRAYFLIATSPAIERLPDGRNAHITVHPLNWWETRLRDHFSIVQVGKTTPKWFICECHP